GDRLTVDFSSVGIAGRLGSTSATPENIPQNIFNATLVMADERGQPMPYLAEALPQLNSDTWNILPDGTMETVYRLRPNLTWHDGQPLTADDFTFSWQVHQNHAYRLSGRLPFRHIAGVAAPTPGRGRSSGSTAA